jgi:hypothetical protein
MTERNVGQRSQYLWTYRDAAGECLDGGKAYKRHVLPGIPVQDFWFFVVYDSHSLPS